jgi:hypothetical protein
MTVQHDAMWEVCHYGKCENCLVDESDARLKNWFCAEHGDGNYGGFSHENLLRCSLLEIDRLRAVVTVQEDEIRAADAQIDVLNKKVKK